MTDRAKRIRVGFVRAADATLRTLAREERAAIFTALKCAALIPARGMPMHGETGDCIRVVAGRWECVVAPNADHPIVLAIAARSTGNARRGLEAIAGDPDLAALLRAHMKAARLIQRGSAAQSQSAVTDESPDRFKQRLIWGERYENNAL